MTCPCADASSVFCLVVGQGDPLLPMSVEAGCAGCVPELSCYQRLRGEGACAESPCALDGRRISVMSSACASSADSSKNALPTQGGRSCSAGCKAAWRFGLWRVGILVDWFGHKVALR